MKNIIIDDEFRDLLPALSEETLASLEANLIENGCRDSLVLWNGILVDGHNRYAICTKYDIPFNTVDKEFASREEAIIWIISTQVSRRSLTPEQLRYYRGKHYNTEKKAYGMNNKYARQSINGQNDLLYNDIKENTADRLGIKYCVSPKTIRRDAKAAEAIDSIGESSPEAKKKILSREAKISKRELEELSGRPDEDIKSVAVKIENGVYEKEKSGENTPAWQEIASVPAFTGILPLNAAIDKISGKINSGLHEIIGEEGCAELKASLRSCIERLEELCGRV